MKAPINSFYFLYLTIYILFGLKAWDIQPAGTTDDNYIEARAVFQVNSMKIR